MYGLWIGLGMDCGQVQVWTVDRYNYGLLIGMDCGQFQVWTVDRQGVHE